MPGLSDLRLGADVVARDGTKVGFLVRVLVAKEGFDPQALVVKVEDSLVGRALAAERFFVTDEVVVPIAGVESATHDTVSLAMSLPDVRRLPPYLSYRFVPLSAGAASLEEAAMLGGAVGRTNTEEVANKAAGVIEIEGGENVMLGSTGRRLGRVEELLYDKGELIGVVIRPDGWFKQDVVLPIRFISRADDLALFAEIKESDVEALKPFTEGE